MFRTHQKKSELDRIIIDFDMKYLGNNDIQASILNIPVGIKYENNIITSGLSIYNFLGRNVKIAGKCRVVLSPTLSELPFIGGVQMMFLTAPEIDFQFDGAARIASKLPSIKEKFKTDMLEDMSQEIIFPSRVTLPLSWSADPELVWHHQVSAILAVRLKSVEGLPKKGSGKS